VKGELKRERGADRVSLFLRGKKQRERDYSGGENIEEGRKKKKRRLLDL